MATDLLDAALAGCAPSALSLLRSEAQRRRFARGEGLYRQGEPTDGVHLLCDGIVIVERGARSGDVTSYRVATNGEFVGHRSYFAQEARTTTPRCLTDVVSAFMPNDALDAAIARDPTVGELFSRALARDDGPKLGIVAHNTRIPGVVRLTFLLDHLIGKLTPEGDATPLPLTQGDLANLLDLRPETVSRLINQLEDRGVLRFEHSPRRVVVSDRPALRAMFRDYL